ncbi:hypothetical protein [Hymenobacter pini]|uniref:hypothetical protein n=1 Tax=Hymenobacter pini TaxID=2880879 RepID=UPI001CF22657|nr:hypothetical protein [Hymenobacter pini]MCA8832137.1 hypothetical protein [Hymenobacter pini]
MSTLRADLHDLLAFEMLSRHTLDILQHKHGVNEGELFSALMQVLREKKTSSGPPELSRSTNTLVCGPDEHICRHCGDIFPKQAAMKHLWQAHDLIVRRYPEKHYTTDIRLAALYREARAANTDPRLVVSAWEALLSADQQIPTIRPWQQRQYLVRRRGYTMLVVGDSALNGRYQRHDLNRDSQRWGFARCLRGTFVLVPMRA